MASKDTQDFSRDLATLQTRSEDEALVYKDMPPEGKRKCMDDLENALHVLQKIKKNLKEADEHSSDKNLVQVLWKRGLSITFTKEDFEQAFHEINAQTNARIIPPSKPLPVPNIKSVVMQDGFRLDDDKYLQSVRLCFIQFSNDEDYSMVLGLEKLQVGRGFGHDVKFIQPTHSQAMHKTLCIIGNSLFRLGEIDKELKKIGAVKNQGGMPELGREFVDNVWYLTKIQECKRLRAAGVSLDLHSHALLAGRKPVDVEALKQLIKPLYDEECDILIQLREYQLGGLDFNFKHTAF
jgi:hypothetical protein